MREFKAEHRGKARFLVDESIGSNVAKFLQDNGFNTKYVADIGLLGHSDEDVFAAAWKDNRIIVTHDPDFLDDRKFPPHRNPGVILVRPGADGRDDRGLLACLAKATLIAGENAEWFRRRKLDFSTDESRLLIRPDARGISGEETKIR
jgi:predicted nuclease of predicted toxin-antitoxin system